MTIDKEKLISLLIDRTGSEREHVESQLSQLIGRIKKAAEEGKSFEIEGFGIFSLKNERLQFEPSDILETEINNKYAGMKPIELIGAFKEADIDATEISMDKEVPLAKEDLTEGVETGSGTEEEDKSWVFDKTSANDQERIEKAVFGNSFTDAPEVEPEAESNPEIFKPADTEEEETPGVWQDDTPRALKTETDKIGKVLVAVVAILIIGLAGWLIYDSGLLAASNTISEQGSLPNQPKEKGTEVNQTATPSHQVNIVENKDLQAEVGETAEPDRLAEVRNGDDSPDKPENTYGLQGELNGSVSSGYTIVVHSLGSLEQADRIKKILHADSFRVMIMEAMVNGSRYYRVGLGQFKTIDAAQKAVGQLPEKFKNDNFIKRF